MSGADLLRRMDSANAEAGRIERERLRAIREFDRRHLWWGHGFREHAHFLAARYGISQWKARRWIGTAHALEHLPITSHALTSGLLSLDKVVELSRFATGATEKKLVSWARRVTPGAIRKRADAETRASLERTREVESDRHLSWWWHQDDGVLEIEGRLPPAEGSVFISAVDRMAKDLPDSPPEEGARIHDTDYSIDQRRADALALLCSARIADDKDPDRAMVVVHAPYDALTNGRGKATIANGPAIDPHTAQRLACDSRLEVVLYGDDDKAVGIGRASREPTRWLRRQVLYRDSHTCTFPGCEMKRFLHLHHMHWWDLLGPTNLDNLITVCTPHHKLVHEWGWSVKLQEDDTPVWFRPSGRRFEPGPAPPDPSDCPLPSSLSNDPRPWPALWHMLQSKDTALGRDESIKRLLTLYPPAAPLGGF
ncbi:MAG: HNH endonuclease [Actinomycetota bacterium]|nr:HNH endonuclease [Actinomycetota bacterium]